MTNQIPEIIKTIIDEYKEAQRIENEKEKQEQKRQAEETNAKGKAIADEWIQKAFLNVPAWLHQYYASEATSLDYHRIVNGWESERDLILTFAIPGLAQIQLRNEDGKWRSQGCGWDRGDEDSEPYIHFGKDCYWRTSLEATLAVAKSEMEEHQSNLTEYAKEQVELAKRTTKKDQMKEEKKAARQAEEEALLRALGNDPVAIHLLKAFLLLRDERSRFEQRLNELGGW